MTERHVPDHDAPGGGGVGYLSAFDSGRLERVAEALTKRTRSCDICPHQCGVDRPAGDVGFCGSGAEARIASYGPHFGEESPLVGRHGSGTVFFAGCNMRCVYCQNSDISQVGHGHEVDDAELAGIMLQLQRRGCHNINLVTPTHMIAAVLRALVLAVPEGLSVPLVYNSGGYDSVGTLRELSGVVDIYMPDLKYADEETARRLSGIDSYPSVSAQAVKEMHAQVGDLVIDASGVATKGLIVRHLVLPEELSGSKAVIDLVAELSRNTYLNIMDQYHPSYRAREFFRDGLGRRLRPSELEKVVRYADNRGITRIDDRGYLR
jgi:putative pyruvate formate lyase activating enzyme